MSHIERMRFWLEKVGQELLAVAAISAIGIVYLGFSWETRPASILTGRVAGFGLVEQKGYGQVGSVLRAQVDLADRKAVSIALPERSTCKVGSAIEIEEAHALFGSRYRIGRRQCRADGRSGSASFR